MRSLFFVLTAIAVMCTAFWAYRENYQTQASLARVDDLQRKIGIQRESLSVLRAEWAYLNRPDRLRDLADLNFAKLGLLPFAPEQFGLPAQVMYPHPEAGTVATDGRAPIINPVETAGILPAAKAVVSARPAGAGPAAVRTAAARTAETPRAAAAATAAVAPAPKPAAVKSETARPAVAKPEAAKPESVQTASAATATPRPAAKPAARPAAAPAGSAPAATPAASRPAVQASAVNAAVAQANAAPQSAVSSSVRPKAREASR